jgi:glycosyltransferase involved in cell wall biosynthesis
VTYAGAHGLANDLDTALDAAKILRDMPTAGSVSVRFIGDGAEKPRLQARANAEGLTNVEFRPSVSKDEIYRSLSDADAFLMPLKDSPVFRWGISPNKLYDYLALQRPIIFAIRTRYNPVADSGAGITVPPEDAHQLADAITRLAAMSHAERREIGHRGRQYVENHHSYSVLAERFEGVLEAAHSQHA